MKSLVYAQFGLSYIVGMQIYPKLLPYLVSL